MKILKQILFVVVLVAGMSLGVSAQKGGGQRPPKEQPKIEPKPKQTPKGDQRPKKPGYAFVIALPENTDLAE
jgi:hypothetical protein